MTIAEEFEKKGVLTVALNFLRSGFADKTVAENTGLSLDEIHRLKLEHGLT